MATYICLIDFTAEGVRNFKQSPQRAHDFQASAEKLGVSTREVFWTLGEHDGVLIFDAADDETATAAILSLAGKGNVKTHTMRAFKDSEIVGIIDRAS